MTLKTCKATEETKKVVLANEDITATPQCSTEGHRARVAPPRRDASNQTHEDVAGVRCEPYREQTHPMQERKADAGHGIVTARAGSTAGVTRQDHLSLAPGRHAATEGDTIQCLFR